LSSLFRLLLFIVELFSTLDGRLAEPKIDNEPLSFINTTNEEVLSGHALGNPHNKNRGISRSK
jgi:hypothetical protein